MIFNNILILITQAIIYRDFHKIIKPMSKGKLQQIKQYTQYKCIAFIDIIVQNLAMQLHCDECQFLVFSHV